MFSPFLLVAVMFNAATVSLALGLVLPVFVATITKKFASDRLKAMVSLISAFLVSIVTLFIRDDGSVQFDTEFAPMTILTFLASGVAYRSFWKPVLDINDISFPDFGFGGGLPEGIDELTPEEAAGLNALDAPDAPSFDDGE